MENQQPQNNNTTASTQEATTPIRKKRRKYKKVCWLCKWGCLHIDYKNTDFLKRYLKNNKIITHKITGNCLRHQHQIAFAIKRARVVALLPFVGD